MSNIAVVQSGAADRGARGPGGTKRLRGRRTQMLIQERLQDPLNWYAALMHFDREDLDTAASSSPVDLLEKSAGTYTFVDGAAVLTTAATTADAQTLHPAILGKAGLADYWDSSLQPFIWCNLAVAPALLITQLDATIGLADSNPGVAIGIASSAEAEGARFILENGAAAANWFCETSVTGVDTRKDTGSLSVATTYVELAIFVAKNRRPYYYFNGTLVHIGPGLTAASGLSQMAPFIQIAAGDGTANDLAVRMACWGQRYEA